MFYFLKLGGSLITDKNQVRQPRRDILAHLAQEIRSAYTANPDLHLIIGHGSGSFGHVAGQKYGTRHGVRNKADWLGFVEVWKDARALNQIVVEALLDAELPVMAFPPSAAVISNAQQVRSWDIEPIQSALSAGLIPLVNGDVVFDVSLGGTILSTEDLFIYLALTLKPDRILLAGIEPGVWADFPACKQLVEQITPDTLKAYSKNLAGSAAVDVTGGMAQKVESMLALTARVPGLKSIIFSGIQPDLLRQALLGELPGTVITQ
ncbi:MAG: isopentenyl phosphate kinase [Anaerolineaceae bacterium]|nr:isopentenyl phosphate kinase [Anaerolineaceae bacterium]